MGGSAEKREFIDKQGLTYFYNEIKGKFASKKDIGAPLIASTAAGMTDENRPYVYTGTTGGGLTN